jgi:hypothetical protein
MTPTKTKPDPFYMGGTEGTGEYRVVLTSNLGRVGYRVLGQAVRVRVEPRTKTAAKQLAKYFDASVWKQPGSDGQDRFSTMPIGYAETVSVIEYAVKALGTDKLVRNGAQRTWRHQLRQHFGISSG